MEPRKVADKVIRYASPTNAIVSLRSACAGNLALAYGHCL